MAARASDVAQAASSAEEKIVDDENTLRRYLAFGGVLSSVLQFPELPAAGPGRPEWIFTVSANGAAPGGALRGERLVAPEWTLRLFDLDEGWRFEFGRLGAFDVASDNRHCSWVPGEQPNDDLARSMVVGPVASLTLENRGYLCLHGSAVATAEGVIGFLAPKHHGKSTLALALTLAGARLVTDDLVVVRPAERLAERPAERPSERPSVRPGVHALRMFSQHFEALPWDVPGTFLDGPKGILSGLPADRLQESEAPLAALYILEPNDELEGTEPCLRVRLRPGESVAMLGHQAKLPFGLVGPEWGRRQFGRAAQVAGSVPLFRLRFQSGLERLPSVSHRILEWHGGGPSD